MTDVGSKYPKDLITLIKKAGVEYSKKKYHRMPQIPNDDILKVLLDTAYHASFLTEEDRKCRFRIIYCSPYEIVQDEGSSNYYENVLRIVPFSDQRGFSAHEINRLAPVAEYERMLIGVYNMAKQSKKPDLKIWGILDTGENWWRFINNESEEGTPPPEGLTIESRNPGELMILTQGDPLISLRNGQIIQHKQDALLYGALADFFIPAKKRLYQNTVKKLGKSWNKDDDYPYNLYISFLKRILFHIQQKKHGGCLIIIPSNFSRKDTRITDRINLKYPCDYNFAWDVLVRHLINYKKYYDLHFKLWDGKLKLSGKNSSEKFQEYSMLAMERDKLNEGLGDIAHAIACLSTIDGAVVMTDSFKVIGFGGEVTALSPSLKEISVHDTEPNNNISIDNYGTRHRSAFRFCSSFEESVAFIVSQDGGVKATKRVQDKVILWQDILTTDPIIPDESPMQNRIPL